MKFQHDGITIPTAPSKDPDDEMSWGCDWSDNLAYGEVILKSSWISIPSGLVHVSTGVSGPNTAISLAGGEIGVIYTLTNRITTDRRVEDRSMYIPCLSK